MNVMTSVYCKIMTPQQRERLGEAQDFQIYIYSHSWKKYYFPATTIMLFLILNTYCILKIELLLLRE